MRKLPAVEEAKALMDDARDWPVWRWLLEKGRVRAAADEANAALSALEKKVKAGWSEELQQAYRALAFNDDSDSSGSRSHRNYSKRRDESRRCRQECQRQVGTPADASEETMSLPEPIRLAAECVKQADDAAENARLDAEATFDEAERRLSTALAREGTQKAIASWELREKAIRQAEALGRKQAGTVLQ